MAKISRCRDREGVYYNQHTDQMVLLENVWLEQFYDTRNNQLVIMHTATLTTDSIERTKNVQMPGIDNILKLGKL